MEKVRDVWRVRGEVNKTNWIIHEKIVCLQMQYQHISIAQYLQFIKNHRDYCYGLNNKSERDENKKKLNWNGDIGAHTLTS